MKDKQKIKVRKNKEGLMGSATKPHKDKSTYSRKNKHRGYWEDLVNLDKDLDDLADKKYGDFSLDNN